jgi:hypothetical protein
VSVPTLRLGWASRATASSEPRQRLWRSPVSRNAADEPLVEMAWRRVLWGSSGGQTIVDLVRAEAVGEHGERLRHKFARVADEIEWKRRSPQA